MIIKNMIYEGIPIPSRIVVANWSDYSGMIGEVFEVRTGEDKETENECDDYYCSISVDENDYYDKSSINKLINIMRELYRNEHMELNDIITDVVIMDKSEFKSIKKARFKRIKED